MYTTNLHFYLPIHILLGGGDTFIDLKFSELWFNIFPQSPLFSNFFSRQITNICFLVRNLYLASITSTNHILVWNIRKGTQILTIDQYIDPPIVTVAGADEQYLVAFFSGSNVMRTWGIGQECVLVKEFAIISTRGIHKDESVCVSLRANADKVLYAFRSDNRAYVTDATTGQRVSFHLLFCSTVQNIIL